MLANEEKGRVEREEAWGGIPSLSPLNAAGGRTRAGKREGKGGAHPNAEMLQWLRARTHSTGKRAAVVTVATAGGGGGGRGGETGKGSPAKGRPASRARGVCCCAGASEAFLAPARHAQTRAVPATLCPR